MNPTPKTRREVRRTERREAFLVTARKLFLSRGYDATTIETVARRAGFSKRAVYLDFPSKSELFGAVLAPELRKLQRFLEKGLAATISGREEAWTIVRRYADFALRKPRIFELVMTFEQRDFYRGRSPEGLGPQGVRCLEINEAMSQLFDRTLERGVADGSLRADRTVQQLNLLIWSGLVGVLRIVRQRSEILGSHYQITAEELVETYLDRMLPTPDAPPLDSETER